LRDWREEERGEGARRRGLYGMELGRYLCSAEGIIAHRVQGTATQERIKGGGR